MNFDELKKQWEREKVENVSISENVSRKKDVGTSIDMIRKWLKSRVLLSIPLIIGFFIWLNWFFIKEDVLILTRDLMMTFSFLFCLLYGYYNYRLWTLYKKSYALDVNSKNNLLWFCYEIRSYIEIRRLFIFTALILFWVGQTAYAALESKLSGTTRLSQSQFPQSFEEFEPTLYGMITLCIVVAFVVIFLNYVGREEKRQVLKIEKLIDALNEDE